MADREELIALADAYEAGTEKCVASGYEEFGPAFQRERGLVVTALRRLASSDGGVKVRELEWSDRGVSEPRFKADAVTGTYYIEHSKSGLFNWWTAATRGKIEVRTLEAAKAAAQSDYEARIRSALVEVPVVKGEPEPVALTDAQWLKKRTSETGVVLKNCERSRFLEIVRFAERHITAPGATTKSDVGLTPNATTIAAIEELKRGGGEVIGGPSPIPFNGYSEYTPVTVRGSTSDRSSTRSEVTPSLEGDAAERVARIIDPYAWTDLDDMTPTERFVRESRLPWMREDALAKARAILATGLVPDEAAVRADEREKCAARFRGKDIWTGEAIAAAIRSGGGE